MDSKNSTELAPYSPLIFNSKLLTPLKRLWIKFGEILGRITSPIILMIIYLGIVFPTNLMLKILITVFFLYYEIETPMFVLNTVMLLAYAMIVMILMSLGFHLLIEKKLHQ